MSVNVYLNEKKLKEISGFNVNPRVDRDQKWNEYSLPGISLSRDMGRYYIMLQNLTRPIPEILKDCVEEITCYETFKGQPSRIIGLYKHEDAIVELDVSSYGYTAEIRGKTMENMYQLYLDIRSGKAFPETGWDQEQVKEKPKQKPAPKKIVSIIKETDRAKYTFV